MDNKTADKNYKVIQQERLVPFSAEHMYKLVADIESYPQYIQGCKKITILERKISSEAEGIENIVAEVEAGYGPISMSYISHVTLFLNKLEIKIIGKSMDGEDFLSSNWTFKKVGNDQTLVKYHHTQKNPTRLKERLAQAAMISLSERVVDSFVERAGKI